MDVFNLRNRLIQDYSSFVQSFIALLDQGTTVRIDVPIPFAASLANMTGAAVISDLEDACPVIG